MTLGVLHMAGWFFPQSMGGTEVYVHRLAQELQRLGVGCDVAIPRGQAELLAYEYQGLRVRPYTPAEVCGWRAFSQWLGEGGYDLIHVHSITQGLGLMEIESAKEMGLPVVLTVHTPDVTCQRGTLMRWGRQACDGRMIRWRCAGCYLHKQGLPRVIAEPLGCTPAGVARGLRRAPGRLGTALGLPQTTQERIERVHRILDRADRVVAVCRWLYDVLRLNGVPQEKLSLSRQATDAPLSPLGKESSSGEPLRLGYLGRFHPVKGVDVLVRAVRRLSPQVRLTLTLCGTATSDEEKEYLEKIRAIARLDSRIRVEDQIGRDQLSGFFRGIDVLAVPSVWLETGPLVVMEALAHGVPVLGSNLGGIAELIEEGGNGWLVAPGDSQAWAEAILRLAGHPEFIAESADRSAFGRRWSDVAAEMIGLYHGVVASPIATI